MKAKSKIRGRMRRRNKSGLRKYIGKNLAKGHSIEHIKDMLITYGYAEKRADAIIEDYKQHEKRKGRLISNNLLAAIIICFIAVNCITNYLIISSPVAITGKASLASGKAKICVNTQPVINISNCSLTAPAEIEYYCVVNASDLNWQYTSMNLTFYDNATLFDISKLDNFSAEINFTPAYPADLGGYGYTEKNYTIEIKAGDGSGCSNENASDMLQLTVVKNCNVKSPPQFNNLGSSYALVRDASWNMTINATDADMEDSISFSHVLLKNYSYSKLNSLFDLDSSGELNISPDIRHIGWHAFNITVQDNSGCLLDTTHKPVNFSVAANNSVPAYLGGLPTTQWYEDQTLHNAFDLDGYFSDANGDCLKYEVRESANIFVSITNNIDPRAYCWKGNYDRRPHLVTFTATANWFGREIVCFRANDTINVSAWACEEFEVLAAPENIPLPSGGATSPPSGGGGAMDIKVKRCEERWYCHAWGECTGGFMHRNCTDMNECGTSKFKPNETTKCTLIEHCFDGIQNQGEEGIDCGGECDIECATCYDAVMNCHSMENGTELCEQGIDCGGPCRECAAEELIEEEITGEMPAPDEINLTFYIGISLLLLLLLLLLWLISRKRKEKKTKQNNEPREKSGKAESKEAEKVFDISTAGIKLDILLARADKLSTEKSIRQLSKLMKKWLSSKYKIGMDATYEEINSRLKPRDANLRKFFENLKDVEYSGRELTKKEARELIQEAAAIIKKRRKKRAKKTAATAALVIAAITLGFMLFSFRPEITGLLIGEQSSLFEIGRNFTQDSAIGLDIGSVDSFGLSGRISRDADARIYLNNRNNLILDSSLLLPERVKTDKLIDFNGSRQIDLKLDYNHGTQWDADDDGTAALDGAVDLTVKDSLFSYDADYDKLCTLWKVSNSEGSEYFCYGSAACCSLLEIAPESSSWDDTFYLTYGAGAVKDNIVSAKIIYANYSLEVGDAYADIIESETENISVNFGYWVDFENICADTCSLDDYDAAELIIEVSSGRVYLEEARYEEPYSILENNAPEFIDIPDIAIDAGEEYALELSEYASDRDNDVLEFKAYQPDNVRIAIEGSTANFIPDKGFTGKAYTYFTANDSKQAAVSELIEIIVRDAEVRAVQGSVRVGRPVKWTKQIKEPNNTIKLEHNPINVSVSKISGNSKIRVESSKVKIRLGEKLQSLDEYTAGNKAGKAGAGRSRLMGIQSMGLAAEEEQPNETELVIEEQAEELEVEYYTEAPIAIEKNISENRKRVVVSSDTSYTDILAFTEIDDKPREAIRLYHVTEGGRESVDFESFDRNGNGLTDYIEWTVPHLSNQTYEVEITVLNVQSYPTVGGKWEVRFVTTGRSNLSIEASNGTTYGSSLPADLEPHELRCADDVLEYNWSGSLVRYDDYECNSTGYWTVTVLTEGRHIQKFVFGNATAYANNMASVNDSDTNLTIWDDTDFDSTLRATDMIIFYANYTNMSKGKTADGTCEIQFNFTGSWQNKTNMTYNGADAPWNYSRIIPYKGTTYFNVKCMNNSMATLNATDSISIINTKPIIDDDAGRLADIIVYEDTPLAYNFSRNVSDVDLNDVLSYGYKIPHPFPNDGVFSMDYNTGVITFVPDTNDEAGMYDFLITAEDTEASSSTILPVNITAVNDQPQITNPSGNLFPNATSESYYEYDINATDEEDSEGAGLTYNISIYSCQRDNGDGMCNALNISFNRTTGLIKGTPTSSDPGNYTINVSLTDSGLGGIGNKTDTKLVNLTVVDVNNPPVFTYVCDNSRSAEEDTLFSCILNATDPDVSDDLDFSSNLSWFNIENNGLKNATANFTPLNMHVGNYSIRITVTDGALSDESIIDFTVNNTNDAPWIYNISNQTAIVGLLYNYTVNAYDYDFLQPYNTFTAGSEDLIFGINNTMLSITKLNETAAYMNFTATESRKGNYAIRLNVTDLENATYNLTFNLTIRNNTAPRFEWICNGSRAIQEEILTGCRVNATDLEGDNFTFSVNASASWFMLNSITGNVSIFANDTEVGNHSLEFNATDVWGWSSSELITNFSVNNTPEAPYFHRLANLTATQGVLFTLNLSENVSDEDMNNYIGDTIYYYVNDSLPSGNFSINATTGLVNFTPSNADVGIYVINFTLNDSYGLKSSMAVNFTVLNVNDAPVLDYACDNERSAREDVLFNCTINATDADGDSLTFDANLTWFNITNIPPAGAIANFTPLNAHVGNHSININVTDGMGGSDYIVINFTVNNTNDAPYFSPAIPNLNATEDFAFIYDINATDDDLSTPAGDSLLFRSNSTLFTVDPSTGIINFTPSALQTGNYSIRLNVTDSQGAYNETAINFTVLEYNDYPILNAIPNFNVEEGNYFYYDANATDEEDGNDTLGVLRYRWNHSGIWFELNASSGEINFTANSSMIGMHTINISVNDSQGREDWQLFNITVRALNFRPNITAIRPYGLPKSASTVFAFANRTDFPDNLTAITLDENTSILFNHTATDANLGNIMNSSWYKDGSLVYSTVNNSYTYTLGFLEAGSHNITLVVDDNRGKNDSFRWNVTVNNANRKPIFGLAGHSIYGDMQNDFAGTESNTNMTGGGIILKKSGGNYLSGGEFISESFNIGSTVTSFYNSVGFSNISWTASLPAGTNATLQTQTSSNGISWGNWSNVTLGRDYVNPAGERIASENRSYIRYKLILTTTDNSATPNVTRVMIRHMLPDLTIDQGSTTPNWVDLDDYFHDIDSDDSLSFTATNTSHVTLSIDNSTNYVQITAPSSWFGRESVVFTANDSYDTERSNNITIIVEQADSQPAVQYVYISSTSMVIRTRIRTVEEPQYLEVLAPGHIAAFDEETVVAPIALKNNGEAMLNDLTLSAEANTDLVDIWFDRVSYSSLAPGQEEESSLFIKWEGMIGEFDIIVNASSRDPEYSDSAVISVTGLSRVTTNRSIHDDHIEFVRDLLDNNPECLELTELLESAQRSFEAGDYGETKSKINFVIEGCRHLITAQQIEQPAPIEPRGEDLFKLISGILLMLLFIAVIIIVLLTYRERRL
ncbi:hypothetical protein GF323_07165 [Candidatus Woesearchaeota archaeon]|nr:hypothetical protein [Candidatus Woesearchaeota archaeon]